VARVFAEYIADAMDRYSRPAPPRLDAPTTEEAERAASVEQTRTHYVAVLLKWVVRVVAVIGALVLILQVWNVPVRAGGLNWRLFGLSALVVLVALLIDRIIFIALFSLQTGGRLPASTANISRRWARGVLTVVVVLAIVAIAGFEIDSIWSFMTALLAMVAIGFVAVWSMLSNILATLIILIWRPFNVGERIEILPEGIEGQVIDINFIYTVLKSDQGTRVSIPNNLFAQKFIRRQSVRSAPKRTLAEQLESEDPLGE
jgi:small-conductance mechanosensitive channel